MEALANAICELLSLPINERARLGKLARLRVERNFEIGEIVNQYEAFFTKLVTNVSMDPL
jgi:glycosyltransferase involved in cell wall biosynthesis